MLNSAELKKIKTESFIEKINKGERDFSNTDLTAVDFKMAKESIGREDFLSSSNMSGANLEGVELLNINLTNINFSNADLSGANLKKSDLSRANFKDANLSSAGLVGTKFNETNLIGANLSCSELSDSTLLSIKTSSKTNFTRCYLDDADFEKNLFYKMKMNNIRLSDVSFRECKIVNVDFSEGNIESTEFLLCSIHHVDFSKDTNLIGANFDHCTIKQSNFSGSCLRKIFFNNLESDKLDFTDAVLYKAEFSNSNLSNANFTNANLRGVFFENVDFSGATFVGSIQATFSKNRFAETIEHYYEKIDYSSSAKEKIDEIISPILYLLNDGVLSDKQLKEILGPISEESGKSTANNFLTNLIRDIEGGQGELDSEDEMEEEHAILDEHDNEIDRNEYRVAKIKTLLNRIEEIETRLSAKDITSSSPLHLGEVVLNQKDSLLGKRKEMDQSSPKTSPSISFQVTAIESQENRQILLNHFSILKVNLDLQILTS